ncbi:cellulase family glycosylhydrolase [Sediminibacterium sp.]|uniref:glycoside hydrolase family 5 protein n=1 Tax=Sediminibacterium sp. TaxID=1917865 RepID=UPI0025E05CFC|nr:cellulase family glycosylhydrolase [Sediminibacterium sp.]MBT9483836.1 cellulase family glycosylhydrolase [Sediminibacterium sp.]
MLRRTLVLTIYLFLFGVGLKPAQTQTSEALRKISQSLGQGVNISLLEQHWQSQEQLLKTNIRPMLESIAEAGFETVRLPVAFDYFMREGSVQLNEQILQKLHETYMNCRRLNLKLVIVYHYGKLNNQNKETETERIIKIWKQVINYMREFSYEKLFLELYNEPTTDMDIWKSTATTLVRELRKEDPDRIFIIGGANYNGINELLTMGKLSSDDGKILYTFHFYEPYVFTHQGAEWTKEKTYMTGLPYPFKKRKMPELLGAAPDSEVIKEFERFPRESNFDYLFMRIKKIKMEADKQNLPLICTETGVINLASAKAKSAYLRDITSIMKRFDIPVMLWDYNDKFGISKGEKVMKQLKNWLKD